MSFLFRASNIVTVSLPFGNLPPVVCKKAPDNFYSTHELINNDRKKNSNEGEFALGIVAQIYLFCLQGN